MPDEASAQERKEMLDLLEEWLEGNGYYDYVVDATYEILVAHGRRKPRQPSEPAPFEPRWGPSVSRPY